MIQVLDGPNGPVYENKEMLKVAVDYYKNLSSFDPRPEIRLKPDFFSEEEKVDVVEYELLDSVFT
jgi:hypothetical protein